MVVGAHPPEFPLVAVAVAGARRQVREAVVEGVLPLEPGAEAVEFLRPEQEQVPEQAPTQPLGQAQAGSPDWR